MSTFIIDVDDTLCVTEKFTKYSSLLPRKSAIKKTNDLFDEGHKIILFTSRNMRTFDGNLKKIHKYTQPVLKRWLTEHGVKYHELIFGKPWGEDCYYVDDKNLTIKQFLEIDVNSQLKSFLHTNTGYEKYDE